MDLPSCAAIRFARRLVAAASACVGALMVPVQVVKTSLTLQIAPSERLQEAETVQRHPAGPLRTPL